MPENNKFFDIIPPQKAVRVKAPAKKSWQREIRWQIPKKLLTFLVVLCVLCAAAVFVFLSQGKKVEIVVFPLTEDFTVEQENIEVKKGLEKADFEKLILPGIFLETENELTETFPASFVDQEKTAEGIITVFNNYSTSPLTLRAQTRFLSDSGKIFKSLDKIVVPGKKLEEGKWVAGQITTKVVAAQPGQDYNIGPSKFSLPGLAGTSLYTLVYGESFEQMHGGFSGKGRQVTKEDLAKAKDTLLEKLKTTNLNYLKEKFGQAFVIFDEEPLHQEISASSSEPFGQETEKFSFTVKVRTKTLAFRQQDWEELIAKLIKKHLPPNRNFWEKSLVVLKQTEEFDLDKGRALFDLQLSGKIYEPPDKEKLFEALAGKTLTEATFLLKNQFSKVEIKKSPFWLKKIPASKERFSLFIGLD